MEEKELPWSQVVESDQVYSAATQKWYEIESTKFFNHKIKVKAKGVPKAWENLDPTKMVKVRRGETGKVVDIFIEIMSSG